MRRAHVMGKVTAAVLLLLAGCAGEGADSGTEASSGAAWPVGSVPTAEQLAAALITDGDLTGTWTVNIPQDAPEAAISGVVTQEAAPLLPRIELCDKASAEARKAASDLRWQAFRQLDMTPADPIDMAAGDRSGHMVFAQEFLLAGDPAQVESTFGLVSDGMRACLGEQPATEDGETIVSEALEVPALGEDRYAELDTVGEPGGRATWYLNNVLVRDGPVLMMANVAEIIMGEGLEAELSRDEVNAILTTTAAKVG